MNRSYADITSRLGEPLWWDGHAVPRYEAFKPEMCGVYDRYIAYLEIACQACVRRFHVAVCVDGMFPVWHPSEVQWGPGGNGWSLTADNMPHREDAGIWHYGDPPRHGCIGDTMNCIDLRIVEFWERTRFDWVRRSEYEIEFEQEDP